ncbi:MAG: STAS domain-containing protein [Planctomycetota bacterium]|nr:STAS domain-containing protein [Planctomycetota bacterium]
METIESYPQHRVTVVRLKDESFDRPRLQELSDKLVSLVEDSRDTKIILDVKDLKYIASEALGILVFFKLKADKLGCKIVLHRLQPQVKELLEITGLEKIFDVMPDRGDSLLGLL